MDAIALPRIKKVKPYAVRILRPPRCNRLNLVFTYILLCPTILYNQCSLAHPIWIVMTVLYLPVASDGHFDGSVETLF